MSQNWSDRCVVDGEKPEVDKLSVLISFSDTTFLLFVVLVFCFAPQIMLFSARFREFTLTCT